MRPSKYDKYICIICLIVFIYSFFIVGFTPVYKKDITYPNRPIWWTDDEGDGLPIGYEWSSAVLIAPITFIFFFLLILFEHELYPVDRHWFKKKILYIYYRGKNR